MRAAWEVVGAFLAVFGLFSLLWLLWGEQILPAGGRDLTVILPVSGDGRELERTAAALTWLRDSGLVQGRVYLWDRGLSPEGRALAEGLVEGDPTAFFWTVSPEEWESPAEPTDGPGPEGPER